MGLKINQDILIENMSFERDTTLKYFWVSLDINSEGNKEIQSRISAASQK